jgi:hypothetical protein
MPRLEFLACGLLTLMQVVSPPPAQEQCAPTVRDAIPAAAALMAAGATADAERALGVAHQADSQCVAVQLAHLATAGWNAARAAAARGGIPETLVLPRRVIADLEKLSERPLYRLENAYSRSILAAAMAAAQEERDEMRVHLEQAAWLRVRVDPVSVVGLWPLPLNEAEGELWLEVDDVPAAVVAFRRAVSIRRSDVALLGLARSAARQGDHAAACAAYREWLVRPRSTDHRAVAEAREQVEKCK